jgi:hypothetical protein
VEVTSATGRDMSLEGVPEPLMEITITVHRSEPVHRSALFSAETRVESTVVLETQAASLEDLLDVVGRNLRRSVT